jgi:glycosyltransferase involved in cell wall biosynthesis
LAVNNLLLITYSFPPAAGVGVQRALSLAKYLPEQGFRVHVLTVKNPAAVGQDQKVLEALPESVSIYHSRTLELPFRARKLLKQVFSRKGGVACAPNSNHTKPGWFQPLRERVTDTICPDPQVFWVPLAIRHAAKLIGRHNIDTILVTAPPFSVFLIGNALKHRFPNTRLITDYRDEWLTYYLNTLSLFVSPRIRAKCAEIERQTIHASDRIVAATHSAIQEIRLRYPSEPADKFAVVHNGYDPLAFASFHSKQRCDSRIVITYTGTIYAPSQPDCYLAALDALPGELAKRVETRIIGHIEDPKVREILSRRPSIRLHKFLPQKELFQQMEHTDYLLLIWNDKINIPGKLFEYMATGKPILALTIPGGEAWRMIKATGSGWCADLTNREETAGLLRAAADGTLVCGKALVPKWEAIRRFERPRLVAEYGDVIRMQQRVAVG